MGCEVGPNLLAFLLMVLMTSLEVDSLSRRRDIDGRVPSVVGEGQVVDTALERRSVKLG